MTLGQRIKKQRIANNFTQAEVAATANISRARYIDYETDKVNKPMKGTVEKIALALNCTPEYLLYGNEPNQTVGSPIVSGAVKTVMQSLFGGACFGFSALLSLATLTASNRSSKADSNVPDLASAENKSENSDSENDHEKIKDAFKNYRALAIGRIMMSMIDKGITFQSVSTDMNDDRPLDIPYRITGHETIKKWHFCLLSTDILKMVRPELSTFPRWLYLTFLFDYGCDPEMKVSIVIDDPNAFSDLIQAKGSLPYRGYFSVILIDSKGPEIKEEFLTSYSDDGSEPLRIGVRAEADPSH